MYARVKLFTISLHTFEIPDFVRFQSPVDRFYFQNRSDHYHIFTNTGLFEIPANIAAQNRQFHSRICNYHIDGSSVQNV